MSTLGSEQFYNPRPVGQQKVNNDDYDQYLLVNTYHHYLHLHTVPINGCESKKKKRKKIGQFSRVHMQHGTTVQAIGCDHAYIRTTRY